MLGILKETPLFISEFSPLGLIVFSIMAFASMSIISSTQSFLHDENDVNEDSNSEDKSRTVILRDKELRSQITQIIESVSARLGG